MAMSTEQKVDMLCQRLANLRLQKRESNSEGRYKPFPVYDYQLNGSKIYRSYYRIKCWWMKAGRAA